MSDDMMRIVAIPVGTALAMLGVKVIAWCLYRVLPPGKLRTMLFKVR